MLANYMRCESGVQESWVPFVTDVDKEFFSEPEGNRLNISWIFVNILIFCPGVFFHPCFCERIYYCRRKNHKKPSDIDDCPNVMKAFGL